MITEKYLIENGFYKEKINDNIYYINGWLRLEKCFCGYIVNRPYKTISTVDELKDILK